MAVIAPSPPPLCVCEAKALAASPTMIPLARGATALRVTIVLAFSARGAKPLGAVDVTRRSSHIGAAAMASVNARLSVLPTTERRATVSLWRKRRPKGTGVGAVTARPAMEAADAAVACVKCNAPVRCDFAAGSCSSCGGDVFALASVTSLFAGEGGPRTKAECLRLAPVGAETGLAASARFFGAGDCSVLGFLPTSVFAAPTFRLATPCSQHRSERRSMGAASAFNCMRRTSLLSIARARLAGFAIAANESERWYRRGGSTSASASNSASCGAQRSGSASSSTTIEASTLGRTFGLGGRTLAAERLALGVDHAPPVATAASKRTASGVGKRCFGAARFFFGVDSTRLATSTCGAQCSGSVLSLDTSSAFTRWLGHAALGL
mmetsp:Transcript_118385/g.334583  ORF Transcript_118385/g.334583 Transcript_118385/m.334583 type:complete len:381 (+) Transcript_118385:1283-2425(+)